MVGKAKQTRIDELKHAEDEWFDAAEAAGPWLQNLLKTEGSLSLATRRRT